jgi:Ca2+-binding EF-hand superfamily protein
MLKEESSTPSMLTLARLLKRDQCEKDVGSILKSTFLSCQYTEEGLADKMEFEKKFKAQQLYVSRKTTDTIYSCIASKKSPDHVSFIKIKQVDEFLKNIMDKLVDDEYHAKDLMYGKLTAKKNYLDHPLINLLEIKMEEKFKTIHDAFRTFDTNGDSKLNYSEFEKGMLNLNTDLTRDDIKKAFMLLDDNQNGDLEYHEFCESFDGYKRRGNPMITSSQTKDISSGMLKLKDFDKKFKRESGVKYNPPSVYGIANSGLASPLNYRISKFRNSNAVSGFGSKSSRRMDLGQNEDDKYSTMDDILSQASEMRSKMNLPIPKNKDTGLFMKDLTNQSNRSPFITPFLGTTRKRKVIYNRNLKIDKSRTYGHVPILHKDIGDLINHEYMNNFTQRIQQKSDKMRQDNKAKIDKLKDYSNYKLNNTVLKRNSEIKKKYLTSRDSYEETPQSFFSPQREVSGLYGRIQSPIRKDFMISATRPS